MTCLMQLQPSAHAQLMEFRKQNAHGYLTANGRRAEAAKHMRVIVTVFKMLVSRAHSTKPLWIL